MINKTLNFTCIEYIGSPVLDVELKKSFSKIDDIKEGMEIAVAHICKFVIARIDKVDGDTAQATSLSKNTGFKLEFSKDHRGLWVNTCTGNLNGIKRLKFY